MKSIVQNMLYVLLAGLPISSSVAQNQSAVPTLQFPDSFLVGKAPDSITSSGTAVSPATESAQAVPEKEGPAALNGSLYAVIAPIFDGSNGTSSFVRLVNGGATTSTFSVSIVGSPSGTTYGTANIAVATRAAPQFALSNLLSLAGAGALSGGDTEYALYIQNPEAASGFQHVTFNGSNSFFENASICTRTYREALTSVSNSVVLPNVHTSLLGPWPSQVELHNYWNLPQTYRFTIVESTTGNVMGQVDMLVGANASYNVPFTSLQDAVGWQPTSGQSHANVVVTNTNGGAVNAVVGHSIVNNALSANINMTMSCAVNPDSGGQGGGFGDGGFSY